MSVFISTRCCCFSFGTLSVSLTVSTTIPLHQDPLGVDVAGPPGKCSELALFYNVPCGMVALSPHGQAGDVITPHR